VKEHRLRARFIGCAAATVGLMVPLAITPNVLAAGTRCKVTDQKTGKSYRSFQAAVAAATTPDTLVVSGTCASTSETIISGLILTIKGKKGTSPTISLASGSTGRVLGVFSSANVVIDDLKITGGNGTGDGGGLDNFGKVTLNHVKVTGNSVVATQAASIGAGIVNEAGAKLTLNYSKVTNNTAMATSGQSVLGGGIFDGSGGTTATAGIVKIKNSVVTGNVAGAAPTSGGSEADYAFGGGIYVSGAGGGTVGATVSLTGTTSVTGNTAEATSLANGGGVYVQNGGNYTAASTTSVTGNVPNNVAGGG
jgi:hypothetical protein